MQVLPRLRAWLSSPRADRVVLALIALLSLLAIDTGLGADDHIHELILRGSREIPSLERAPLDLFAFVTGEPSHNARMMRDGVLPWWTDLEARISFFRPLSSATHWLDYQLWPDHPWLMHLHSLLWFWAGVLGIRALYLRLTSSRWVALLALLMYGIDDARGAPITWIANRHALVSCAFAVWALVAHIRWREEKSALGMVAAPALFAFGLLGGESTVGMAGYFVAYALIDPAPSWTRRLAALLPIALTVVGWRLVYGVLGYGVRASGIYVDPGAEPLRFAVELAERTFPLLLSQLALPWSEWWMAYPLVMPALTWVVGALAAVVIVATAAFIVPIWKRDRTVRFWTAGALMALVPLGSTFPSDRMLLFVAIGAFAVVAELFAEALAHREVHWRGLGYAVVAVHLVIAPLSYPLRARGIVAVRRSLALAYDSVPKDAGGQTLVFVNPPMDPYAAYVPVLLAAHGKPVPRQLWLATGATDVVLERLDARTLRVEQDGGFLRVYSEWMLRDRKRPFRVGDRIDLGVARIVVTKVTEDGRPAQVVVEFDRELEQMRWMNWEGLGYVDFQLPKVGQKVTVPKVDLIRVAFAV